MKYVFVGLLVGILHLYFFIYTYIFIYVFVGVGPVKPTFFVCLLFVFVYQDKISPSNSSGFP